MATTASRHVLRAQAEATQTQQPLTVGEIAFPSGVAATVGQEVEIRIYVATLRPGVCYSTRWSVTAPDGSVYDPNAGHRQIGCKADAGEQFVRLILGQPSRPDGAAPMADAAGPVWVRSEVREITGGTPNGPEGPPTVRTAAFVAEDAGAKLLQQAQSAAPQNLAAAYLSNRNRLDLLAAFGASARPNLKVFIGSVQVTPSNAQQLRTEFQEREDIYAAEIRHRGVPQVAGRYRFEVVQPCGDKGAAPLIVNLVQTDFAIDVRDDTPAAAHRTSGVATAGTLTSGEGDFSPDTYSFGTISDTGPIEMRSFSDRGCSATLTRVQAPAHAARWRTY
jgi:hypothetical protein